MSRLNCGSKRHQKAAAGAMKTRWSRVVGDHNNGKSLVMLNCTVDPTNYNGANPLLRRARNNITSGEFFLHFFRSHQHSADQLNNENMILN